MDIISSIYILSVAEFYNLYPENYLKKPLFLIRYLFDQYDVRSLFSRQPFMNAGT
ncbi:hypothetical protein [Fischerella thermalis]|uniref:hypothetical protein n=1 Tax=Fischerella thermalis TaxID=372787 RepID=UPI0015E07F29|nr:hypothetical protein [Fischerella thermalis]